MLCNVVQYTYQKHTEWLAIYMYHFYVDVCIDGWKGAYVIVYDVGYIKRIFWC